MGKEFPLIKTKPRHGHFPFRPHPPPRPLASRWNVAPVKAGFPNLRLGQHPAAFLSLLQPLPSTTSTDGVHAHGGTQTRTRMCRTRSCMCVHTHYSHTQKPDLQTHTHPTSPHGHFCILMAHVHTLTDPSPDSTCFLLAVSVALPGPLTPVSRPWQSSAKMSEFPLCRESQTRSKCTQGLMEVGFSEVGYHLHPAEQNQGKEEDS